MVYFSSAAVLICGAVIDVLAPATNGTVVLGLCAKEFTAGVVPNGADPGFGANGFVAAAPNGPAAGAAIVIVPVAAKGAPGAVDVPAPPVANGPGAVCCAVGYALNAGAT
jgi:hypothetical protein